MEAVMGILGMLGMAVAIVLLLVRLIAKKGLSISKVGIVFLISFVLFVSGVAMTKPSSTSNNVASNNSTSVNTTKKEEPKKEDVKKEEPKKDVAIKAGMYKIGQDIKAGEYVVVSSVGLGYLEVTKDSSGTLDSIITNDNISGRVYITVSDGQYLNIKNANVYPVNEAPKVEPKDNKLPSGMYKVGVDLKAGEYKVSAAGNGYVEVAKSSKGILEDIVTNDNFNGEKYITVKDGQYIKLKSADLILSK